KAPSKSGLFLLDIKKNQRILLVSLAELAEMTRGEIASDLSAHYVTHTSFSHDSRYISFLHRWVGHDRQKRYTKLGVFDLHIGRVYYIPLDSHMVSHYAWLNDSELVAYCNY